MYFEDTSLKKWTTGEVHTFISYRFVKVSKGFLILYDHEKFSPRRLNARNFRARYSPLSSKLTPKLPKPNTIRIISSFSTSYVMYPFALSSIFICRRHHIPTPANVNKNRKLNAEAVAFKLKFLYSASKFQSRLPK